MKNTLLNKYFQKYGFQSIKIKKYISLDVNLSIVIPCYNEIGLIATLNSLKKCLKPQKEVEVIIIINQSETVNTEIKKINEQTFNEVLNWKNNESYFFSLHVIFEESLPKKHAGVGLARKIGMDEAVMRFEKINKDGIIVCLDADCLVQNNYFVEIEKHFNTNPKSPGCAIKYEHPLAGNDFNEMNYEGIINYELFLRYYNLCLKFIDVPYAFHTVGSSMAVKSSAYQKQGGMNKRKAGEDFYFLHKIIELGNFTELNSTTVYPSPRTSDRVPFGTGKAINDFFNQKDKKSYLTYSFESFKVLKCLFDDIEVIYKSDIYTPSNNVLVNYLTLISFKEKIKEIKNNTSNFKSFKKRFYTFINAFQILKFVHFSRDNYFINNEIKDEVNILLNESFNINDSSMNKKELLLTLRNIENEENY